MTQRHRAWADTIFGLSVVAGAAQSNNDLLANAPTIDTITAVRLIIQLEAVPTLGTTVDGVMAFDIGVGVTSLEAFTANATPDVNSDDEYPPRGWLYIGRKLVLADSPDVNFQTSKVAMFDVDIRSMRKVDKGKLYLSMSANQISGTSFSLVVGGRVRVLCLT